MSMPREWTVEHAISSEIVLILKAHGLSINEAMRRLDEAKEIILDSSVDVQVRVPFIPDFVRGKTDCQE